MEGLIIRQRCQPTAGGPTGVMARPLCLELRNLPLQIGLSLFQHRAVPRVVALLEFLNHPLKRQAEALLFAEPTGLFLCQTRLCDCSSCACIFLLRLDGLAFPAPSHGLIIARIDRLLERPCNPSFKHAKSQKLPIRVDSVYERRNSRR